MATFTEAAKRLAERLGIDINTVEGTGADGNILVADVEASLENGGPRERTVDVATLGLHETPPNHDRWVRVDWSHDRMAAIGRNILAPQFGVLADQVNITKIDSSPSITFLTGHVDGYPPGTDEVPEPEEVVDEPIEETTEETTEESGEEVETTEEAEEVVEV